ncbi:MAG: hypothetical protein H6732_14615 [Alphaproteobacteria bacterium]|nr:hypothetical protein [Alphaproteobacteria bacterium]
MRPAALTLFALLGCQPGTPDAKGETDSVVDSDTNTPDSGGETADTDDGEAPLPPWLVAAGEAVDPNDTDVERLGVEGDADPLPGDAGLETTLQQFEDAGGSVVLDYDPTRRTGRMVFVTTLTAADVTTKAALGDEALVDVDGVSVRVATFRDEGATGPQIVVSPQQLVGLQLVSVYTSDPASAASGPRLDVVGLRNPSDGSVLGSVDGSAVEGDGSKGCNALAMEELEGTPPVAVHVPPLSSCTTQECKHVKVGWTWATHDVWRLKQLLAYVAKGDEERRAWLWKQEGVAPDGTDFVWRYPGTDLADEKTYRLAWSPEELFGPYTVWRFDAIRWAVERLWDDMHDHDLNGLALDIECTPDLAGDICNTYDKAAWHHIVKSNLKACPLFFQRAQETVDGWSRVLGPIHEPLHHLQVPWKDGAVTKWNPMQDTHTHGHGDLCATDVQTNKGYGLDAIAHLAHWSSPGGSQCGHREKNFRNNDTYTWAAAMLGMGIRYGWLKSWPRHPYPPGKEPSPAPGIPPCSQAGFDPPAPGHEFFDPLQDCYKSAGELVCPPSSGSGSSGGLGKLLQDYDLAGRCPED